MTESALSASLEAVRRLAVTKQHLAARRPRTSPSESILAVVRDLAFVQWDPISIVAPSHVLSLWSRIDGFSLPALDRLLWREKKLFLTWTPIASIVPTEDYPLHHSLMRRYPDSLSGSWGAQRERARWFLEGHKGLRKAVLAELRRGPRVLTQFSGYVRTGKRADGWTSANDLSSMLSHLLMTGEVMVVGHQGNQNVWGLAEEFLPRWTVRTVLTERDVERRAAERAIRALGTASAREINYYFVRGRYPHLKDTLKGLVEESTIQRIRVAGIAGKDERYIHRADISLLDSVSTDAWQPRVSLLAPFDNLICGRDRTSRIFGFDYVHEQFLPKGKRRFGTYVLPILWGSQFIGRVDPRLDREKEQLVINSVHAEPGAPTGRDISSEIAETLVRFADFLGAKKITYGSRVPAAWRGTLR